MGVCCSSDVDDKFTDIKLNDLPKFNMEGLVVDAKCVKVYDGDTITVVFAINEKNFKVPPMQYTIRISNLDCAEKYTDNKITKLLSTMYHDGSTIEQINDKRAILKLEQKVARQAEVIVSDLCLNKIITLHIEGFGKYGRTLATVYARGEGKDIATLLVNKGWGYRYNGKKKKAFEEWYKARHPTFTNGTSPVLL